MNSLGKVVASSFGMSFDPANQPRYSYDPVNNQVIFHNATDPTKSPVTVKVASTMMNSEKWYGKCLRTLSSWTGMKFVKLDPNDTFYVRVDALAKGLRATAVSEAITPGQLDVTEIEKKIANIEEYVSEQHDLLSHGQNDVETLQESQTQLLNVINNTANIKAALEGMRTTQSEKQIDELTERLERVLSYTHKVEDKLELAQRQGIINFGSSTEQAASPGQLHGLLRSKHIPSGFKSLLNKYIGAAKDYWTAQDAEGIVRMKQEIVAQKSATSNPEDLAELQAIEKMVDEIGEGIRTAFAKKMELLVNRDLHQLNTLLQIPDRNEAQEYELRCLYHDLYWDFRSPIDFPLSFEEFIKMVDMCGKPNTLFEKTTLSSSPNIRQLTGMLSDLNKYDNSKSELSKEYADNLFAHKMRYLQNKRIANLLADSPRVLILGGGPGGLMRALVAGVKGARVEVMEKREEYTRANNILLTSTDLIKYFGIFDYLKERLTFNGPIKDIENAILHVLEQVVGPEVIQHGRKFVGIQLHEEEGNVKAGCLIAPTEIAEGGATWHPAEFIIDATGANTPLAQEMGNRREAISKPTVMVVFSTPGGEQILTGCTEDEKPLLALQEKKAALEALLKIKGKDRVALEEELKKTKEEINAMVLEAIKSIDGYEEGSQILSVFSIQVTARQQPAQMLGDTWVMQSGDALVTPDPITGRGCAQALSGATLFSHVLDNSDPATTLQQFVYGSQQQIDSIIADSYKDRGFIGREDLYDTVEYETYSLLKMVELSPQDVVDFKLLLEKAVYGIPYTKMNQEAIKRILPKIESMEKSGRYITNQAFISAWERIQAHNSL